MTDGVPVKIEAAPRAYHHGDLRSALVATAREVLETAAPEAVTLKSLALRLGVSQSAPYRHFGTREAVLAAVAADGFVRFRQALIASQADAPPGEEFQRACLAYIAFGRANRGVYKLMFASPIVPTAKDGPLEDAANQAFEHLIRGVGLYVPPERTQAVAIWVWSTLHGLVMLDADGMLAHRDATLADQAVGELVKALKAQA